MKSLKERDNRECGNCSLCCKLVGLESGKPSFAWCRYCHPNRLKACSIYEVRPEECRKFACLWLSGQLPEEAFPKDAKFLVIPGEGGHLRIIEDISGVSLQFELMFLQILKKGFIPEIVNKKNYKMATQK